VLTKVLAQLKLAVAAALPLDGTVLTETSPES